MDQIDRQIIGILNTNGRAKVTEISNQVNLSIPAVSDRIRNLEDSGIIKQYSLILDSKRMGYGLSAYIFVSIDTPENTDLFRKSIMETKEVLECHHIAGEYDYMLKVLVEDTDALESFISSTLKRLKGVNRSRTVINLSTIKHEINPSIKK